uniref:Uncharacterized protein n=1 Tax=Pyrodinium bahamense TaxID=73915 RepID=A0A7S0AMA3_9DINO
MAGGIVRQPSHLGVGAPALAAGGVANGGPRGAVAAAPGGGGSSCSALSSVALPTGGPGTPAPPFTVPAVYGHTGFSTPRPMGGAASPLPSVRSVGASATLPGATSVASSPLRLHEPPPRVTFQEPAARAGLQQLQLQPQLSLQPSGAATSPTQAAAVASPSRVRSPARIEEEVSTASLQVAIQQGLQPLREELRELIQCMVKRTEQLETQVYHVEGALLHRIEVLEERLDALALSVASTGGGGEAAAVVHQPRTSTSTPERTQHGTPPGSRAGRADGGRLDGVAGLRSPGREKEKPAGLGSGASPPAPGFRPRMLHRPKERRSPAPSPRLS